MTINPQKLKKVMATKIISVAELARLSNVSACTLNMILNHNRKPNIATTGKIAAALGVDVTELIEA